MFISELFPTSPTFSATLSFFLATINKEISTVWNVERVMSMLASYFAASSFCLLYLYTGEIAPTSHRGMISAAGSIFARISAFLGPLLSTLNLTNTARLCLFGAVAGSCVITSCLLPETRDRVVPDTPVNVKYRRQEQGLILA